MMKISKEVASSEYYAIANDALKDEDNGIWSAGLPQSIQAIWLERFYWIRWVDRLAEQDQLVQPGGKQFPAFYQAWQQLYRQRRLAPSDHSWRVLQQIEACWFVEESGNLYELEIEAWNCYMQAILDYHKPGLTIATLQDYETMLDRLAGACFQLLPFLEDHQRTIARGFGVVDQFYNNLRDLYEDSLQGVCYFPNSLLEHFGLTRHEILNLTCFENPGYTQLMKFWVDSYLPRLRQQNLSLMLDKDLHPAWQCLTAWFVHRYMRIERVIHECQYNFVEFAHKYWAVVHQDLQAQRQRIQQKTFPVQPQLFAEGSEIYRFLQLTPAFAQGVEFPESAPCFQISKL